MKKYVFPLVLLAAFEAVAVILWLMRDNLFYLFNFSYIGVSISLGVFLFVKEYRNARRIVQLLVGLYMLVYLGLICGENMQIEGFWYYLFTGVFEAATIHYAVAKIFGPLLFGRGWCGYACWTAMVLDFLPFKVPGEVVRSLRETRAAQVSQEAQIVQGSQVTRNDGKPQVVQISREPVDDRKCGERRSHRNIGWLRYVMFAVSLSFVAALFLTHVGNIEKIMFWAFIIGNLLYYVLGILLAFIYKDNRAFCKYLCPITVFLKPMSYFSLIRVKCDKSKCISCGKCRKVCPMEVDMLDPSRRRKNGTECILCLECKRVCPRDAL